MSSTHMPARAGICVIIPIFSCFQTLISCAYELFFVNFGARMTDDMTGLKLQETQCQISAPSQPL